MHIQLTPIFLQLVHPAENDGQSVWFRSSLLAIRQRRADSGRRIQRQPNSWSGIPRWRECHRMAAAGSSSFNCAISWWWCLLQTEDSGCRRTNDEQCRHGCIPSPGRRRPRAMGHSKAKVGNPRIPPSYNYMRKQPLPRRYVHLPRWSFNLF